MALEVTPVHRNLHQRVTFFYLEFEDLFIVIGLAAANTLLGVGTQVVAEAVSLG